MTRILILLASLLVVGSPALVGDSTIRQTSQRA